MSARTSSIFAIICMLFFIYIQIINTTFNLSSTRRSPFGLDQSHSLLRGSFEGLLDSTESARGSINVRSVVNDVAQRNGAPKQLGGGSDFEGDIVHVVYTRFMQTQHKLVELGKARAELFKSFCLPSMIHQTEKNFLWIIRTDPMLDSSLRNEMVNLLKPHPHFLLIASNKDSDGLRNATLIPDILDSTKVLSGDASLIRKFHKAAQTRSVLETRLDADDALHIEFLENMQQTAREVFKNSSDKKIDTKDDVKEKKISELAAEFENGKMVVANDDQTGADSEPSAEDSTPVTTNSTKPTGKWMYWCADVHMEWHPGKDEFEAGMLIARMPKHCVTPGLTKGYDVGVSPNDIPAHPHHKLLSRLKECQKETIHDGGCVKRMSLVPSSLRARTVTSAGMADVGLDLDGRTSDKWWEDVRDTFGITKEGATSSKQYLKDHQVDIAIENLKGQCTAGHSCKQRAKDRLKDLLGEKADISHKIGDEAKKIKKNDKKETETS